MAKELRYSIGVDTCKALSYSCLIFGKEGAINFVQNQMTSLLAKHGAKIPHYNEISKAIRKKSLKEIQEIVKSSRDVSFLVFEHKKPMGAVSREYYLKHIPINIIDNLNLPTDTNKNIVISLDVHNDFRIKGIKDSIFFVESLVKKMSQKINKSEYKGVHRLDGFVRSNFPHKNITVNIKGRKCQKNDSNAVVLADLVLGYHRCYKPFGTKISYIKI